MSAHKEPGWVSLLSTILRDTPKLTGAVCVNRPVIFDVDVADPEQREYAIARATGLCKRCPCLERCAEWASTQRHLVGVVAGELHSPSTRGRAA
ncbi:WhiB family transcriptional regulator [Mycolicibacterium sp. XJ1904]